MRFFDTIGPALWWLVFIAVLLIFKENRSFKAALIAVPTIICMGLIWLIIMILGSRFGSATSAIMTDVLSTLVWSITIYWMLAKKLAFKNRFASFIVAVIYFLIMAWIGANGKNVEVLFCLPIFVAIMLFSFVLACRFSSRKFSKLRFALQSLLWSVICGLIVMVGFALIMKIIWAITDSGGPSFSQMLMQVLIVGLIMGTIVFVFQLPFIIFVLKSSVYRPRFENLTRLKAFRENPEDEKIEPEVDAESYYGNVED